MKSKMIFISRHLVQFMVGLLILTTFNGCDKKLNNKIVPSHVADKSWIYSDTLDVNTLLTWNSYGLGYIGGFRNQALQMTEDKNSKGLMIISPKSYGRDVSVSYEVMTLRPATVLVIMFSSSMAEESDKLILPEGFDGDLTKWPQNAQDYFFAFHNAPHFRYPFVTRRSPSGGKLLQEADRSYMNTGVWHKVEAGSAEGRIWLTIDDKIVLDTIDSDPLGPGHISFRIRGSGTEVASCFIRNVVLNYNNL